MEHFSNDYVGSSSLKSSPARINRRFLRSTNVKIREFKDFQFYDHVKRNLKGTNVNSDASANSENANNLITYEHLGESWLELVLPLTILGITLLGVLLIAVILFVWIRRYFTETEKRQTKTSCAPRKCAERKTMNSRKWLRGKHKTVDSRVVGDLEQKLETAEFKNSPPTSPNSQKQNDDEGEPATESETEILDGELGEIEEPLVLPMCEIASYVQPTGVNPDGSQIQQQVPSSSPLSFLQGEVHCIQPREDQTNKIFKSIATSPPPFSPHIPHKYATTGTQTYFTKAPNSPNNHLLASSFAVLQTPTTSTVPSGNPFDNKENREPAKFRNTCHNKTISSFKDGAGTTSSSPSSPSSVISTSPKINSNVLQQQNSPADKTFTNSPSIASANYKFGNYFRFPDVGTPPAPPHDKSSSSSSLNKQSSTNTSDESTDVAVKSFQNLSMESDRESIILKIDEVESPVVEVKSPDTQSRENNNNLTIRRARLKSISLDSDGARLVEENLTMPVEELVEIAAYKTDADNASANNNNRYLNPKNIYNLTLNLEFMDSSLDVTEASDINMNPDPEYDETDDGICRTPTMKYFRNNKKAVSLDSDNAEATVGKQFKLNKFFEKFSIKI